jgi:hypothetical protein
MSITAVTDSLIIDLDHYWVAPDPIINNSNNARISNSHYWKVESNVEDISGTIRFEYNAFALPRFDNDLVSITEDSLILVYRPGPGYDWKEYPYYTKINLFNSTDGNGFLRTDRILEGEYAFANGELPVFVAANENPKSELQSISVYPNPANGYFTIDAKLSGIDNYINIELFDLQGRLVLSEKHIPESTEFVKNIQLNSISAGIYLLKVSDKNGLLIDAQTVGVSK